MSPDTEISWHIASSQSLASFRPIAEQAGFQFHPAIETPILQGQLTPKRYDPSQDPLPLLLSLPIFLCREASLAPTELLPPTSLSLQISARTAFSCDPGTAFAINLAERSAIAAGRLDDLRLCLHEAIANAVIHGNFELAGGELLAPDQFLERAALLDQRLSDPDFANRPVHLTAFCQPDRVSITITDQGPGFPLPPRVDRHHGLGLIAEKCDDYAHGRGGREITMHFNSRPDIS